MKKIFFFVICIMAVLLTSCELNEPSVSNKIKTGTVTDIGYTSALFYGTVNVDISRYDDVKFGIMISKNKETLLARDGYMVTAKNLKGKEFKLKITQLFHSTLYYYCAWICLNNTQYLFGSIKDFNTLVASTPIITTIEASEIARHSARVGGNIVDAGDPELTECGICFSTNATPSIDRSKTIVCATSIGEFACDLTDLKDSTKYYVRAYATNSIETFYGNEVSFITVNDPLDAIDLGLSVKWGNMNVGAESPEDYGDYFAWGEVTPKSYYSWRNYKWGTGSSTLTKYRGCRVEDDPSGLELSDDAANYNCGASWWRMPTAGEWNELWDECTWTWTTKNGVYGKKVTSRKNGNSIFLPAAGCKTDDYLKGAGSNGYYWSRNVYWHDPGSAWGVGFHFTGTCGHADRFYGYSIRPVCD